MTNLLNSLKAAGHEPILLREKVVVLPFGGRVIGLYPDKSFNVLWVNPELYSGESARSFFAGEGWLNIGGDRSWISPEIDTNFGDPERGMESYDVPKTIDPAAYNVTSCEEASLTLETTMDVLFRRSKQQCKLELMKQVSLLEKPPIELAENISFAGYTVKCILRTESEVSDEIRPGIWNLLQIPGKSQVIIPVKEKTKPRTFFGKPIYTAGKNLIACDVHTSLSFKFGIHAEKSKGFMLSINPTTEPASLIVRIFNVGEKSLYADVPLDDPADSGYMQQVYVDDGALGGFGELEYHSPAIGGERQREIHDICEIWAFTGAENTLREIAKSLLETR